MEKINDILDNLKERFSNPFIFSFVCSWLIFNWQITVGLIWYDPFQIEKAGYNSIFDLISQNLNFLNSFLFPFISAIIYTTLMPIVKNLISALHSWTTKWGDNWNLKILDNGKISINKYLKLRSDHIERTKILEDIISAEKTYQEQYNSARTELLSEKNKNLEVSQKLNNSEKFIQQLYDFKFLDGKWLNNYQFPNGQKSSENIFIENGKYYVISTFGEKEHKFDIKNYFHDNRNGNLFFIKEILSSEKDQTPNSRHYNVNSLKIESDNFLAGLENGSTKIEYRRV